MPESDAQLIHRAREDPEALGELYVRWKEPVYAWLRARAPQEDASELTAEVFAQAALGLERFRDLAGGSAGPWLYGIAKNLLHRYYERGRIEQNALRRLGLLNRSYESDFEAVDERLSASNLGLEAALDDLPPEQREALELRVVQELPYARIAALLGCSVLAARLRVMRALGGLRGRLQFRRTS